VVDVTEACDRLDELAGVVLSLQSATTAQEIRNAIDAPLAAFVTAADHSGDTRLAEFAHTYDSRFSDYLAREDNEAGTDANIALDQAGARCIELGATNNFPSNS
jgi:Iap family predicted aminopeptidase